MQGNERIQCIGFKAKAVHIKKRLFRAGNTHLMQYLTKISGDRARINIIIGQFLGRDFW
jgi:hypothetical protein